MFKLDGAGAASGGGPLTAPIAPPTQTAFGFSAEGGPPPQSTETDVPPYRTLVRTRSRGKRGSLRRRKRGYAHGMGPPPDRMPWLDNVLSSSLVLQNLMQRNPRGAARVGEGLTAVVATPSSALQRLVIITNICKTLPEKALVEAITKSCRTAGGVAKGGIYLKKRTADGANVSETDKLGILEQFLPSARAGRAELNPGCAVVELRSANQSELACQALSANKALKESADDSGDTLGVARVNKELHMDGTNEIVAFSFFLEFLSAKLFADVSNGTLTSGAMAALSEIFSTCKNVTQEQAAVPVPHQEGPETSLTSEPTSHLPEVVKAADIGSSRELPVDDFLTKEQICDATPGNLLFLFCDATRLVSQPVTDVVSRLLEDYGRPVEGSQEERGLGLKGFVDWVVDCAKQDAKTVWKGISTCGYDFQFERWVWIGV